MITVNVAEAKARLAEYLKAVENGETIILARRNRAIAEMRPIAQPPSKRRPFGLCRGEFEVPDDLNDPLPAAILDAFEGK